MSYLPIPKGNVVKDLPSIISLDRKVFDAVSQVQRYCSDRGVELAVATNGHQLIAFLATRGDGIAPLEGRCFVINGYDNTSDSFCKSLISKDLRKSHLKYISC